MPLAAQLHAPVAVTAPDVAGGLAVFPLITDASARNEYVALADAHARGFTVTELEAGASVGDLLVMNPLDVAVLLYEGEEVLGAQQNRTFDRSVLVPAQTKLRVPVSCVEAGRWDGSRHREALRPALQAAHPELRRRKNVALRASLAAGAEGRADQREVWDVVAATAARMAAPSPTGALNDVFEQRRDELAAAARRIEMKCGQVGSLVAIGGRFVVLDYVSDVGAYASLHGRLVAGYALDAATAAPAAPPSLDDARDFLALLLSGDAEPAPTGGAGTGGRFAFGGMGGTTLSLDDELVTLTAFADTAVM